MSKLTRVVVCTLLLGGGFLFGRYIDPFSNVGGYPKFESKVFRPRKPYSRDQYSAERYRRQVQEYLEDAENYCKAVENDIADARTEKRHAVESANEVVAEYNRWVKSDSPY